MNDVSGKNVLYCDVAPSSETFSIKTDEKVSEPSIAFDGSELAAVGWGYSMSFYIDLALDTE